LGAIAVQGVNAQAKKIIMISESQIVDQAKIAAYETKLLPAIKAAGGTILLSDHVTSILGDPPQRVGVTEFDSVQRAKDWVNSAERKALAPDRDPAVKIVRQYIVETR
jgi:uncharacterized protein (DUF1330 family)